MTVVYLDSVFVLNALMDYLLLLSAGRLAGVPLRRGRYALGALLGGGYAAAVFLPGLEFLAQMPVKAATGVLLALVAFGGERKLLRLTLLFFGVSCAMAGCVLGFGLLSGGAIPAVNGVFYTDVSVRVLLVAAGAAYVVLTVVFRASARHAVAGELLRIRVCVGGRDVELTALHDTGNSLRDPVCGAPVLVTAPGSLNGILPSEVRHLLETSLPPADLLEPLRRTAPELRFRLIPYHAVGAGGLLLAVRSDWIEWAGRRQAGVLVALSPTELGTGYAALWGGDADGGRRDHGRAQTETAEFAGAAGAAAGGRCPLHRGQRHAAAAADQGAGEGTAGARGGRVCPAGTDRT